MLRRPFIDFWAITTVDCVSNPLNDRTFVSAGQVVTSYSFTTQSRGKAPGSLLEGKVVEKIEWIGETGPREGLKSFINAVRQ